jgi:hypothetical protein
MQSCLSHIRLNVAIRCGLPAMRAVTTVVMTDNALEMHIPVTKDNQRHTWVASHEVSAHFKDTGPRLTITSWGRIDGDRN